MKIDNDALESRRTPFTLRSENGLRLAGSLEEAPTAGPSAPIVVVAPTYGKTMNDYAVVNWYLLRNGFRVLRYDNTCHLGDSEGEIHDFTPTAALGDMKTIGRFVTGELRPCSWGMVAFSLTFRFALRALAGFPDLGLLFGVVGVVNLRATLCEAAKADVFREVDAGLPPVDYRVMGHLVSSRCSASAVDLGLADLASTRKDLDRCPFPIVHVATENDPWVSLQEVHDAYLNSPSQHERTVLVVPGVSHELHKNPIAAALALEQLVLACRRSVTGSLIPLDEVVRPSVPEMVRVKKLENRAAALATPSP